MHLNVAQVGNGFDAITVYIKQQRLKDVKKNSVIVFLPLFSTILETSHSSKLKQPQLMITAPTPAKMHSSENGSEYTLYEGTKFINTYRVHFNFLLQRSIRKGHICIATGYYIALS